MESRKMLATVVLVTSLFTSSVATSGPSGYPGAQSYGGYNQHQQYQPQQQQQGQWYTEASYQKDDRLSQEETQGSASAVVDPESPPSEDAEQPPLPEGWSEHFDPNSGQYYYYNAADGTTSWDRPAPPESTEPTAVGGEEPQTPNQQTENTEVTDVTQRPAAESERQGIPENLASNANAMPETGGMPDPSQRVESWQSSPSSEMKQQPNEPGTQSLQGQNDHPQVNEWGAPQRVQQQQQEPQQPGGNNWGQSNSTESSFVGGEPEVQKYEFQGQQPQQMQHQQNEKPPGWGMPPKADAEDRSPERVQTWGVSKPPEPQAHQPRQPADPRIQQTPEPPRQEAQEQPPSGVSSGRWGMPPKADAEDRSPERVQTWGVSKPPEPQQNQPRQPADPRIQQTPEPPRQEAQEQPPSGVSSGPPVNAGNWGAPNTPAPRPQQPGSEQYRGQGMQKPPEAQQPPQRRPPMQGPPGMNRPPPQQQAPPQQRPPQYMQRQYPPQPYGSYNPAGPPGQGQYGGQAPYGRGYPPPPQQPSQIAATGQMISMGTEAGTTAVKEALSTTWKGLLGFGNRTREVVGTARDQVVTGATAAGQTISARSSSIWEQAKSTVGGVFENSDTGPQAPYSLGGQPVGDNRPPPGYQGRPMGPNQGYPGGPGGSMGRGPPPPRNAGGPPQQPGRYGSPYGQQPPPGYRGPPGPGGPGGPPGRQQPPPSQHQQQQPPQQSKPPPGYPGMQPRRDLPYPPTQDNSPYKRGPMQSQYGNQPGSPPPGQGRYPPNQQRPPFSGPPGQPNRGPPNPEQRPREQKPQPDPWEHPGLTGEF